MPTTLLQQKSATRSALVPNILSQRHLKEFILRIMTEHKKFNNYHNKMVAVDTAYARYISAQQLNAKDGVVLTNVGGVDAATTPVGVMNMKPTTPPVVVSQVDAMVAYLADVFLSGVPLFPVVSNPNNIQRAEQLETLLDDHATLGGYIRQLLLFLKDGVKYNFCAIEALWTSIDQYTLEGEMLSPGQPRNLSKKIKRFTKIIRRDPYNTIWDHNVNPGDISAEGDYAGYVEILSRTKLKRRLIRMGLDGESFNNREAITSNIKNVAETTYNYVQHPTINSYVDSRKPLDSINWIEYLTDTKDNQFKMSSGNYEWLNLYVRLIPKEFGLLVPEPKTVQIWKLVLINSEILVEARRIVSAYDNLPMLFGQPLEDGLGFQTQSIAEGAVPFQEAAATMLNIRFNAARRAVSDRAVYDSNIIKPSDINAPVPAAKIPANINSLGNKKLTDAYMSIPFEAKGTETALQDGLLIADFAKQMAGLNKVQRGEFQRGNKSVTEFETTIGNSDNILRMPALLLEAQVFQPLKDILKLNIFQFGEDSIVVSQKDGKNKEVKIDELRKEVLAFRVADGYTPKSKLASTDFIVQLLQMILSNEFLLQKFGNMAPAMVIHIAQLQGVRGLEQYLPELPPPQQTNNQQPPTNGQGAEPTVETTP